MSTVKNDLMNAYYIVEKEYVSLNKKIKEIKANKNIDDFTIRWDNLKKKRKTLRMAKFNNIKSKKPDLVVEKPARKIVSEIEFFETTIPVKTKTKYIYKDKPCDDTFAIMLPWAIIFLFILYKIYYFCEYSTPNIKPEVIKYSKPTYKYNKWSRSQHKSHKNLDSSKIYSYLWHDPGNNIYKIGLSKNPLDRIRTCHTYNPNCKLLKYSNKVTESFLHSKYNKKRYAREWFTLNSDDVEEILKLMT